MKPVRRWRIERAVPPPAQIDEECCEAETKEESPDDRPRDYPR